MGEMDNIETDTTMILSVLPVGIPTTRLIGLLLIRA